MVNKRQRNLGSDFKTYVIGNIDEASNDLARLCSFFFILDIPQFGGTIKVGRFFREYTHPKLKGVHNEVRRQFGLAVAQDWLFSKKGVNDKFRFSETLPLAVIIGTGFFLDIDPVQMGDEVHGDNYTDPSGTMLDTNLPVPYHQHKQLWPEISQLPMLSLSARSVFLRIIQFFQVRSGMTEYERVNPAGDFEVKRAIVELSRAKLVDVNPSVADLLMNLTLVDLKQLAFEKGLKVKSTKNRLSRLIAREVSEQELRALLLTKGVDEKRIRPLVSNLPLFKKYIWAEINRLKLYSKWIEQVECLQIPPKRYDKEYRKETDTYVDHISPNAYEVNVFNKEGKNYLKNKDAVRLIHGIWDEECDNIVRRLTEEHGWYSPRYIGHEILDYLNPKVRKSFEKRCGESVGHPYWALTYYSVARIHALGIELRKPRLIKCAGCSVKFKEWSIGESIAKRVRGKFHFCSECYQIACWHDACAVVKLTSEAEMLNTLANLGKVLEAIPTKTFMQKPTLHNLSDEKQVAVVRALLKMPSYKEYVSRFGSWLKSLTLAGILEDGIQTMSRGYRCIANDGHECLSLAEKTIDDWLSEHNIKHDKEPLYPYDFYLNPSGKMRADWKVDETLIEYAGMLSEPKYAAKIENKKELAQKLKLKLIILEPEDILALDKKLGHITH